MYPLVMLKRLVSVSPPDFIEVEFDIQLVWEDDRIYSYCDRVRDADASDPCGSYWIPELIWPTALTNDDAPAIVTDYGFTTMAGRRSVPQEMATTDLERSFGKKRYPHEPVAPPPSTRAAQPNERDLS